MKNWKSRFGNQILDRGLDYYTDSRVRITRFSPSYVEAYIYGTRAYEVLITFKDSRIISMFCDCPYCQNHGLCKHLAATLYYLEENPDLIKPADYSDLLNSLSREELIEFLNSTLQADSELVAKLRLFTNNDVDENFYINNNVVNLIFNFMFFSWFLCWFVVNVEFSLFFLVSGRCWIFDIFVW